MAENTDIMTASRATAAELEKLRGDAGAVACAIALGELCARAGVPIADAIGIAEVSHREAARELHRAA